MKRFFAVILLLSVSLFVLPYDVSAQEKEYCNTCFRGKDKPDCCSFIILESGMVFGVAVTGEPLYKESYIFTVDFGLMFNRGNSTALGGSFHLAADEEGHRFGIGPRYRKWLSKKTALDISPRLMFSGGDEQMKTTFPGFALSVSLSMSDWISFDSYYQIIPYEIVSYSYIVPGAPTRHATKETETGLYFGISGRSYLAPLVPAALMALIAITWN